MPFRHLLKTVAESWSNVCQNWAHPGDRGSQNFFSWTAHLSLNLTIGILWQWRGNSLAFYFRNTFKAPNKSKLKREGLLLLLNGGNVMRRLLSGSPSHGQNGLKRGPPNIGLTRWHTRSQKKHAQSNQMQRLCKHYFIRREDWAPAKQLPSTRCSTLAYHSPFTVHL